MSPGLRWAVGGARPPAERTAHPTPGPHPWQREQILREARIICVADSFSAMIAERPYRHRMTADDACAELELCAGTQFDPAVVQTFVRPSARTLPSTRAAHSPPPSRTRRSRDAAMAGRCSASPSSG
ncbi:MAG TPA: HD domain-containing phosphohydrolase [Thermoleophilaceae bacterium]|nr:HD domain-containing phosphohydrolase [Thermoleophilaceae bacterium]